MTLSTEPRTISLQASSDSGRFTPWRNCRNVSRNVGNNRVRQRPRFGNKKRESTRQLIEQVHDIIDGYRLLDLGEGEEGRVTAGR